MAKNDISVTILEGGIVRIDTDSIAGPDHQIAEKALLWITKEMGGSVTRESRKGAVHHHNHKHSHDGISFHSHN